MTHITTTQAEEQELRFADLMRIAWKRRRLVAASLGAGAIVGLIIALSLPREYVTRVVLAPEMSATQASRAGMGTLASIVGISLNTTMRTDAVGPLVYPDIVGSVPFEVELFDMPVGEPGGKEMTLSEYLLTQQRRPWWSSAMGWVMRGGRSSRRTVDVGEADPFQLTPAQNAVAQMLRSRVRASVDSRTALITVTVKMQSPMVSAQVADSVVSKLQAYVTDYRTSKARQDAEYTARIADEAKEKYLQAQQAYAEFLDRNHALSSQRARVEEERLHNEATLAYNLYANTTQQMQLAQARVQEITPVYSVIQPPTVPLKAKSPRRMLIILAWAFVGAFAATVWVLVRGR